MEFNLFRHEPPKPFERSPSATTMLQRSFLEAKRVNGTFLKPKVKGVFSDITTGDFFTVFFAQQIVEHDPELQENPSMQKEINGLFKEKVQAIWEKTGTITMGQEEQYALLQPLHQAAIAIADVYFQSNRHIDVALSSQMQAIFFQQEDKFLFNLRSFRMKKRNATKQDLEDDISKNDEPKNIPVDYKRYISKANSDFDVNGIPTLQGKPFRPVLRKQGYDIIIDPLSTLDNEITTLTPKDNVCMVTDLPTTDTSISVPTGMVLPGNTIEIIATMRVTGPDGNTKVYGLIKPDKLTDEYAYICLGEKRTTTNTWDIFLLEAAPNNTAKSTKYF